MANTKRIDGRKFRNDLKAKGVDIQKLSEELGWNKKSLDNTCNKGVLNIPTYKYICKIYDLNEDDYDMEIIEKKQDETHADVKEVETSFITPEMWDSLAFAINDIGKVLKSINSTLAQIKGQLSGVQELERMINNVASEQKNVLTQFFLTMKDK